MHTQICNYVLLRLFYYKFIVTDTTFFSEYVDINFNQHGVDLKSADLYPSC